MNNSSTILSKKLIVKYGSEVKWCAFAVQIDVFTSSIKLKGGQKRQKYIK